MADIKELKDEALEKVSGGLDDFVLRDCEDLFDTTKNLINAYESLLAGDNYFTGLKNKFNDVVSSYGLSKYMDAYNKVIDLKNAINMLRSRGDENFRKFVGEFESNVLGIDYLLRQFCTNYKQ